MPSMMENIVMKKCKVKFKLARTIVADARNNMPQENRNCLWSKALEEECLRIYYEQYGVKLGLTRPVADLAGGSSHTQDTTSNFSLNPTDSSVLPRRATTEGDVAMKKTRSIGTHKARRAEEINSPRKTEAENKCVQESMTPTKPFTSPSSRLRRTLAEKTSFSEAGDESQAQDLNSSGKSKSTSKRSVKEITTPTKPFTSPSSRLRRTLAEKTSFSEAGDESQAQDLNSSGRSKSASKRRVKKEKIVDQDKLDLSSHSGQSSRSSNSKSKSLRSKKKSGKTTSSILDLEPSNKSTPRKKSLTKKNALNEPDASQPLFDIEIPISPKLAESMLTPPKYITSPKIGRRLTAGMKGFDAQAARDTTPLKPKVDKSPKKTNRKKSVSRILPDNMLGARPAIMRALEDRKENTNAGQETLSPSRIFIRRKRSKLKSPEKSLQDEDNQSIGPEDLLKTSPDRKRRGSNVSLNNSRHLDGNSSKTRMVPVVRQTSGGNKPAQTRRGSKLRSSFRKDEDSPHTSPRSKSATKTTLFSGGFLVSPSPFETNMDNFQRSSLTRQNSAESFLSIESFSGTSDSSPFDSPVQPSLAKTLPALPKLSPTGKEDETKIAFDSATVSSSLVAPKKPQRQTSAGTPVKKKSCRSQ